MLKDAPELFRAAIAASGLTPPESIIADGELHRFASNGKRRDDAGWYVYHGNGVPAGSFGCWRSGLSESWRANIGRKLTPAEVAAQTQRIEDARRKREAEEAAKHEDAAMLAAQVFMAALPARADHPYLERKRVAPVVTLRELPADDLAKRIGYAPTSGGNPLTGRVLLVPVRIGDRLPTLEFIDEHGRKSALAGGAKSGGFWSAQPMPEGDGEGLTLHVGEGVATVLSLHEATCAPTFAALSCGNLTKASEALRARYPKARMIVCGDLGNGERDAHKAANSVGGLVAFPDFGADRPDGATDFNDLAQHRGAEAVERAVANAQAPDVVVGQPDAPVAIAGDSRAGEWAEPQPVTAGDSGSEQKIEDELRPVLDDIGAFIARFVALPEPWCYDAVVLWVAHAHMIEYFHTTPRLAAISPEPESGKSRLLEIIATLTPEPMLMLSPSPAALFRKLAHGQVTLLVDECDTVFTSRGKEDQNEDLRALLNAGYRRGATIPRCVGPKHDVQEFPVFAATALAGIGDLPDTVMTRSIVFRMRRRTAAEPIEQYRIRVNEPEGHALRDPLARCAGVLGRRAGEAWPQLPACVVDRRAEAWEPLLAIADLAGGDWPKRARDAAVADVAAHRRREPSLGIRLLMDIKVAIGELATISTDELLHKLTALEESPWGDIRGHPLNARGLAARLKKYNVAPGNVRIGEVVRKGYKREDLHDAWSRYLAPPVDVATCATSVTEPSEVDAYRQATDGE